MQELYHNIFISWVPDQWKNCCILVVGKIGGHGAEEVIIPSPDNHKENNKL